MVATEAPRGLSALNMLAGRIAGMSADRGPLVDISIDCNGETIVSRLTRQSTHALGLRLGQPVYAVVKTVSFDAAAPRAASASRVDPAAAGRTRSHGTQSRHEQLASARICRRHGARTTKPGGQSMPSLSLRINLDPDGRIGPGKIELLEQIAAFGSISAAARRMEMSYKRAWDLVEEMNRSSASRSSPPRPAAGGAAAPS